MIENNKKPALVVMAGGLGSRYGGLKQIDPITKEGEIILDFSLFDAYRAGFRDVVLIIREETKSDFDEIILNKISNKMNVQYAFQSVENLPNKEKKPEGREKPWGTAHAIWTAKKYIDGPFAVINADDYYGIDAFVHMYEFLDKNRKEGSFAMVSYLLENTVTENGYVSRGVCSVSEDGYLKDIIERTRIEKRNGKIAYTGDDKNWIDIDGKTLVSMNFWGYTNMIMDELEERFDEFFKKAKTKNILKEEYFIPKVTDDLIKEGKATCKVLKSTEKWYGITYREDKQLITKAVDKFKQEGKYPQKLWR